MPDETPPVATSAPAITPPAAVIPPIQAPPAHAPEPTDGNDPPWLAGRLERAKKAALAELGVDDPRAAKAAIEAARKADEDSKTAAQRLGETSATLKTLQAENDRLRVATAEYAGRMMAPLTAEQKAAVQNVIKTSGGNPEDPSLQIQAVSVLQPTWAAPAPVAPAAPAAATPPATPPAATPPVPPATTAPPAASAPAAGGPTSPPDHKSVYQSLKQENPVRAAAYLQAHARDIYP